MLRGNCTEPHEEHHKIVKHSPESNMNMCRVARLPDSTWHEKSVDGKASESTLGGSQVRNPMLQLCTNSRMMASIPRAWQNNTWQDINDQPYDMGSESWRWE